MIMPLRMALATLAVFGVSWAATGGAYTRRALVWALLALGLATLACTCRERRWRVSAWLGRVILAGVGLLLAAWYLNQPGPKVWATNLVFLASAGTAVGVSCRRLPPGSLPATLLAAVALFLGGRAILDGQVLYGEAPRALAVLRWSGLAGLALPATFLLDLGRPRERRGAFGLRLVLLLLTGLLLRAAAVRASPDPVTDVYAWERDATGHLLAGRNPYAATYQGWYSTVTARRFQLQLPPNDPHPAVYPPLPLLLMLPFRTAGVDVRWAIVGCDLAAALVLLVVAWGRAGPVAGALAAAVHLHLPRTPLLIENGYYEPMLAALLGGGLLLVERGRRSGYLLLGLALTGKQFGVVLAAPLGRALRRHWRYLLAALAVAGAAVVLPFLLWDARAFWTVTVAKHVDQPPLFLALTLTSGLHDLLRFDPPRYLMPLVALVLVGWVSWRTPRAGTEAALWLGTALLAACLCFVKAFFYYYFLCTYLLLLGAAALAAEEAEASPQSTQGTRRMTPAPCAPGSEGYNRAA
jgi:hypothetical protein